MLRLENKKTVAMALIIAGFALAVCGRDSNEIDIGKIDQNNPFLRFAGGQIPEAAAAAVQDPKPQLVVETVTLKFLDARSLKTSITNMSGVYGSIEPDSKGNSLIICDTSENLVRIIEQIRKVDRKPEQVMIEVVLLDVKLDDQTEIGVNWDMLTSKYNVKLDNGIGTSFRQNLTSTRIGSTEDTAANIGNATAFNSTNIGSDFALLFGDIRTIIHVLQEKNNVEIIASPRVMVVSGQNASIEAVEEIPYQELSQTSQGGNMTNVQFKNVGVTLNVGATLTDDKFILLDVEADQKVQTGTSVVAGGGSVPVVDARVVKSSLLLEDGQVLVIGGLRRKDTQKQTSQIPILGDIPIIGLAFKDTITTRNSSELLILLSPHIYKGQVPNDAQMAKFNEITQQPLLTIPETQERKKEEEKVKAEEAKEAEKAKAAEVKEAEKAEKAKKAKEAKEEKKARQASKKAENAEKQKLQLSAN